MTFHVCRMVAYLGLVAVTAVGMSAVDPRAWVAMVVAAVPAVMFSPALLLSVEGLRGGDQAIGLDGPRVSRHRGWQGSRAAYEPPVAEHCNRTDLAA